MDIQKCIRSLLPCLLSLGLTHPAIAQDTPTVELSGGYKWLGAKDESVFSLSRGWYADAAYNIDRMFGIVAQVGGGYDSHESRFSDEGFSVHGTGNIKVHEIMGGVRVNARQASRAVWFGQALVGGVRASAHATATGTGGGMTITESVSQSRTYVGLALGGAVNLILAPRIGVRLGVDSLRVFHEGEGVQTLPFASGDGTNVLRFTGGVVLPFSRR